MSNETESQVGRFFAMCHAHGQVVDHKRERVPEGTRYVGTLWLTPDGEFVVADGSPDEVPEEGAFAHNCDEMGCSSVSHVIARVSGMYASL